MRKRPKRKSKNENLIEENPTPKEEDYEPPRMALLDIDDFSRRVWDIVRKSPMVEYLDFLTPAEAGNYDILFILTKKPAGLKDFVKNVEAKSVLVFSPAKEVKQLFRHACVFHTANTKLVARFILFSVSSITQPGLLCFSVDDYISIFSTNGIARIFYYVGTLNSRSFSKFLKKLPFADSPNLGFGYVMCGTELRLTILSTTLKP